MRSNNGKKKSRWKKILIWSAVLVVVLAGGALFTINYMVDKVLDSFVNEALEAAGLDSLDDLEALAPGGSGLDGNGDTTTEAGGESGGGTGNGDSGGGAGNAGTGQETAGNAGTSDPSAAGGQSSGEAGGGNTGGNSGNSGSELACGETGADGEYKGEVTIDKAKCAQENITLKDKAKVATLLLAKLSPSDMKLFGEMMSGGLSTDEKKQAKDIILKKMSEDEYNELIAIAAKLGLSQGKSYADSLKE